MNKLQYIWTVLKQSVSHFFSDECLRYSASLSFYALFSIAPMVMVSIEIASFLAEDVDFQEQVTRQFTQLVGPRGAEGITVLMESLEEEDSSKVQLFAGVAVLLFSATNIFVQLQGSFNNIYSVRSQEGRGLISQLLHRLISLGMILSLGFIMLTSLMIDSIIVLMQTYLSRVFQEMTALLVLVIQYSVLILLVYLIIFSLLHFLPDVVIRRRYKVRGTLIISVLLLAGKFAIGWYIGNSQFSELGGASASIIILMLWIYYSSMILFFGAELIKSMANIDNVDLPSRRYAVKVMSVEVKTEAV